MDTSRLPFSKGRPAALERADRRKARASTDAAENTKVRKRAEGRCEIVTWAPAFEGRSKPFPYRCTRRGSQTHHMIGGWGKRARGISIFAERKQYVCQACHDDITRKVLQRIGGDPPHWTDHYRRVT